MEKVICDFTVKSVWLTVDFNPLNNQVNKSETIVEVLKQKQKESGGSGSRLTGDGQVGICLNLSCLVASKTLEHAGVIR